MTTLTGAEICVDGEDLRIAFASSQEYLDAVFAKTNKEAERQSIAGLRALLFLLRDRGVDSSSLVLKRQGGKPYFANNSLKFSISHSAGLAVCALSDSDIGVDAEAVREKKNAEQLAKRFFSRGEYDIIRLATDKSYAFLETWTKKEALLKSIGRGIDSSLPSADTVSAEFSVFDVITSDGKYIVTVTESKSIRIIGGLTWIKRK